MISLLLFYILIAIGAFYLLIKAADYFVDEAASIGKYFGMSKLMIGLTVVAIGTSLPETITALGAIFFTEYYSDFLIGTIIGSNTTNILLAFGLFLVAAGTFKTNKQELFNVFAFLFTTFVTIFFVLQGFVNHIAIVLFIFYIFYISYLKKYMKEEIVQLEQEIVDERNYSLTKSFIILIFSFIGLFIGAKLVVFSIEEVGALLAIPTAYLALTTIAIATSLPEIAVTVSSAKKKEYLIGIGNILGTNVMNAGLIVGLSGFFGFYSFEASRYYTSLVFFFIGSLLFSYMVVKKKFHKSIGYLFLTMYVLYLISFFI